MLCYRCQCCGYDGGVPFSVYHQRAWYCADCEDAGCEAVLLRKALAGKEA